MFLLIFSESSRAEVGGQRLGGAGLLGLILYLPLFLYCRTSHRREGPDFFSTHKPTARAVCVACPGNPAALKPPLGPVLMVKNLMIANCEFF